MKSYSKINRERIRAHILAFYDEERGGVAGLRDDREAARHPRDSEQQAAMRLVEGGNFAISYHDQREFLDSLELGDGREYSDEQIFTKYCHLLAREINNLIRAEG